MLRRGEQHVVEPAEHVRPDRVALVAAGQRRDEHLGGRGHAQVIRPEGDEPLDERSLAHDARGQRGEALLCRDLDQPAPSLLTLLRPLGLRRPLRLLALLSIRPSGHAERANRVPDGGRGARHWRAAVELRPQPRARIAQPPSLAHARAEPESVQGAKGGVHGCQGLLVRSRGCLLACDASCGSQCRLNV